MSGQSPSWLMEAFGPKKGPSMIERLAVKMTPVDRLRFGGQDDIADEVEEALRLAYAEGRKDESEVRAILLHELEHALRWFDQLKPTDAERFRAAIAKASS